MKCRDIILPNATENWYYILYDLVSRLWYIAISGPFCKDPTHIDYCLEVIIYAHPTPTHIIIDFYLHICVVVIICHPIKHGCDGLMTRRYERATHHILDHRKIGSTVALSPEIFPCGLFNIIVSFC